MSNNKTEFRMRYANRPTFIGQKFTGKSLTIPGQDLSPAEIIKRFRSGVSVPDHFFTNHPISTYDKMNVMEKIDLMKDLKTRNYQAKEAIDIRIKDLQKQAQLEALKQDNAIKQQEVVNQATNATN